MDFRGTKALDYVSATKNLTEYAKKNKAIQIKWLHDYQWLCDKYRNLEKELDKLCDEKLLHERHSSEKFGDKNRTCLPFPRTANETYGWLASKTDFQLEKYGSLIIKYPNPIDEIVLLSGDVPFLAGGKGLY